MRPVADRQITPRMAQSERRETGGIELPVFYICITSQTFLKTKKKADPGGSAFLQNWWVVQGSNLRPSPCKGDALPAELTTREKVGGADGTRTRDPRRDRPVF